MNVISSWSDRGQFRLPLYDRKRDIIYRTINQTREVCQQLLDRVDIDRVRNQVKKLFTGVAVILPITVVLAAGVSGTTTTSPDKRSMVIHFDQKSDAVTVSVSGTKPGFTLLPTKAPSVPECEIKSRKELCTFSDLNYNYPHLRIETGLAKPVQVYFGKYAGAKVRSGWYSRYVGVPMGKIPKQAAVNVLEQHDRMFRVKNSGRWKVKPVAQKMQGQYAEMYNTQRTYMTLPQFVEGVGIVINETKADLDWAGLCADSKISLDKELCVTLRAVTDMITPEMLVMYGLTELYPMDKYGGRFNAWVLENSLMNYGRESIDLTPAQSDGLASAGLWQFTSKAVGAYVEDGEQRIGGATVVGRHLGHRPPESFLDFVRTDHERAAYLFAVHNVALLIREAAKDDRAYQTLKRVWVENRKSQELLEYIATAHHAPYGVSGYANNWLKDGAKKEYRHYLGGRFKEYDKRTRKNKGMLKYLADRKAEIQKGEQS